MVLGEESENLCQTKPSSARAPSWMQIISIPLLRRRSDTWIYKRASNGGGQLSSRVQHRRQYRRERESTGERLPAHRSHTARALLLSIRSWSRGSRGPASSIRRIWRRRCATTSPSDKQHCATVKAKGEIFFFINIWTELFFEHTAESQMASCSLYKCTT